MATPSLIGLPPELKNIIFSSAQVPRYIRVSHKFTGPANASAGQFQHLSGNSATSLEAVFHVPPPSLLETCSTSRDSVDRQYTFAFATLRHGRPIRLNYDLDTFYFDSARSIEALNTRNGGLIQSQSVQQELDSFKRRVQHLIIPDGLDPRVMDFVADFEHLETLMIEETSAYLGFVSPSRYSSVMGLLQAYWHLKRGTSPMPQVVFKTSAEIQALLS